MRSFEAKVFVNVCDSQKNSTETKNPPNSVIPLSELQDRQFPTAGQRIQLRDHNKISLALDLATNRQTFTFERCFRNLPVEEFYEEVAFENSLKQTLFSNYDTTVLLVDYQQLREPRANSQRLLLLRLLESVKGTICEFSLSSQPAEGSSAEEIISIVDVDFKVQAFSPSSSLPSAVPSEYQALEDFSQLESLAFPVGGAVSVLSLRLTSQQRRLNSQIHFVVVENVAESQFSSGLLTFLQKLHEANSAAEVQLQSDYASLTRAAFRNAALFVFCTVRLANRVEQSEDCVPGLLHFFDALSTVQRAHCVLLVPSEVGEEGGSGISFALYRQLSMRTVDEVTKHCRKLAVLKNSLGKELGSLKTELFKQQQDSETRFQFYEVEERKKLETERVIYEASLNGLEESLRSTVRQLRELLEAYQVQSAGADEKFQELEHTLSTLRSAYDESVIRQERLMQVQKSHENEIHLLQQELAGKETDVKRLEKEQVLLGRQLEAAKVETMEMRSSDAVNATKEREFVLETMRLRQQLAQLGRELEIERESQASKIEGEQRLAQLRLSNESRKIEHQLLLAKERCSSSEEEVKRLRSQLEAMRDENQQQVRDFQQQLSVQRQRVVADSIDTDTQLALRLKDAVSKERLAVRGERLEMQKILEESHQRILELEGQLRIEPNGKHPRKRSVATKTAATRTGLMDEETSDSSSSPPPKQPPPSLAARKPRTAQKEMPPQERSPVKPAIGKSMPVTTATNVAAPSFVTASAPKIENTSIGRENFQPKNRQPTAPSKYEIFAKAAPIKINTEPVSAITTVLQKNGPLSTAPPLPSSLAPPDAATKIKVHPPTNLFRSQASAVSSKSVPVKNN